MPKHRRRWPWVLLILLGVVAAALFFAFQWFQQELQPTPNGNPFYVRYSKQKSFNSTLSDLQKRGVIRSAQALKYYAMWKHKVAAVPEGTYQFHAGMTPDEVLRALRSKVVQMVRIPETNFSYRTANLLEKHDVLIGSEYKELIKDPAQFKDDVDFPLPSDSLEGYLYPDTYDLPPLMGAHDTIVRQLEAFENKIWPLLQNVKNVRKVLTIASMVEMEAAKDTDRPKIAGVIENRLAKKMPLQIDATVLYGLQQWRRLTFADYKDTNSPYNTYLHTGLPPGPICSPSLKSVEAALHPAHHDYLYYVALPTGYHLFARTYSEHEANIAKRREALKHKA